MKSYMEFYMDRILDPCIGNILNHIWIYIWNRYRYFCCTWIEFILIMMRWSTHTNEVGNHQLFRWKKSRTKSSVSIIKRRWVPCRLEQGAAEFYYRETFLQTFQDTRRWKRTRQHTCSSGSFSPRKNRLTAAGLLTPPWLQKRKKSESSERERGKEAYETFVIFVVVVFFDSEKRRFRL